MTPIVIQIASGEPQIGKLGLKNNQEIGELDIAVNVASVVELL